MSWGFATPRPLADIWTTLKADLEGIKGLELVALNRVQQIERNRNIPGLCWSWIAFNLNQIEGNKP